MVLNRSLVTWTFEMVIRSGWVGVIACCLGVGAARSADVTSLGLPAGSAYARALEVGLHTVVISTGDVDQDPAGVYRTSSDFMGAWELIGFSSRLVTSIATYGEQDENIVVTAANQGEVLLSTDGGQSWNSKYVAPAQTFLRHVRIHRDRPELWHVTFKNDAAQSAGTVTTTNSGASWTTVSICSGCATTGFIAFETANTDPTRSVAGWYSGFFESSLYRTTNAGGSWFVNTSHQFESLHSIDLSYEEFPASRTVHLAENVMLVWENWLYRGGGAVRGSASTGTSGSSRRCGIRGGSMSQDRRRLRVALPRVSFGFDALSIRSMRIPGKRSPPA